MECREKQEQAVVFKCTVRGLIHLGTRNVGGKPKVAHLIKCNVIGTSEAGIEVARQISTGFKLKRSLIIVAFFEFHDRAEILAFGFVIG